MRDQTTCEGVVDWTRDNELKEKRPKEDAEEEEEEAFKMDNHIDLVTVRSVCLVLLIGVLFLIRIWESPPVPLLPRWWNGGLLFIAGTWNSLQFLEVVGGGGRRRVAWMDIGPCFGDSSFLALLLLLLLLLQLSIARCRRLLTTTVPLAL